MKSLFLVATPLQALIARRIIETAPVKDPDVWFVSYYWSSKVKRAIREIRQVSCVNEDIRQRGKPRGVWYTLTRRPFTSSYDRVYCALSQPYYFRRIFKKAREIYTFDDGAGNYLPNALDGLERGRDKLWAKLFNLPSHQEIMGSSVAHYALRPDLPNVFPPEKIIPLDLGIQTGAGKKPLTIAIGQPFEMDLPPEVAARMRKALDGLPYFPHPMENPPPHAIQSDEIIEEYVARMSMDHEITLIGWGSTAMLTIPNVRKVYLDPDGHPERRALMQAAGCEIRTLDKVPRACHGPMLAPSC